MLFDVNAVFDAVVASLPRVRLSSFRGFPAGEEAPVQHGSIVQIADADAVFASDGCGTWTLVE